MFLKAVTCSNFKIRSKRLLQFLILLMLLTLFKKLSMTYPIYIPPPFTCAISTLSFKPVINPVELPRAAAASISARRNLVNMSGVRIDEPVFVLLDDGAVDAWGQYHSVEFHHLLRTLLDSYGWKRFNVPKANAHGYESWQVLENDLAAAFGRVPDAFFIIEAYHVLAKLDPRPAMQECSNTSKKGADMSTSCLRVYIFADDLHSFTVEAAEKKHRALSAASMVMSAYRNVYSLVTGLSDSNTYWLPHSASSLFMLPMHPDPKPSVLLAGALDKTWYPYRAHVKQKIEAGDKRFEVLTHPADGGKKNIGTAFANILHGYLACITDGSKQQYAVAKIFEIPATGSLLLLNSEMVPMLEPLGFLPWIHYAPYSMDTLDEVVDWALAPANRASVDTMRRQGQALVWSRHTVSHRASALHAVALAESEKFRRSSSNVGSSKP